MEVILENNVGRMRICFKLSGNFRNRHRITIYCQHSSKDERRQHGKRYTKDFY